MCSEEERGYEGRKRDKREETQEKGWVRSKGAATKSKLVGGKRRAGQKEE